MRAKINLFILLISLLFLAGCQSTFLVHDATVKQVTPILKDYVGTHGYRISYENDRTGSFGVDLGSVYVPYASQTMKSTSIVAQPSNTTTGQPMTAYEQTTWNTVGNSEHYVQAAASVRVIQQDSDVMIIIDTNDSGGASLDDLRDYIQRFGYTVDKK